MAKSKKEISGTNNHAPIENIDDLAPVGRVPSKTRPDIVVAVSSRALFDLDESHEIFESKGIDAYSEYQIKNEDRILEKGVAFNVVKKLLSLNENGKPPRVEVVLVSRNSADTGLRIFNSIGHYGLPIVRAIFSGGAPISPYMASINADLFLSSNADSVKKVLGMGFAAATVFAPKNMSGLMESSQLRIAFDGDAVLFSDESEKIYKEKGVLAFDKHERESAHIPMSGGPFMNFLSALHKIQTYYPADASPIRTALVTARGAPAHERVIRTLRQWGIRIDEAFFLGGLDKGAYLKAFGADLFFDDQQKHIASASEHVPSGHVPFGVSNSA